MDVRVGTSDYGTLPMQPPDATICSDDSAYAMVNNSLINNGENQKIKAYVDFTEFNKNYEQYLEKNGIKESSEESVDDGSSDSEITPGSEVKMVVERQNSHSSDQSEGWDISESTS